ncbi:hypothetical protein DFH08DRAFT_815827 [Mycena albidolilacea]|uniref:Uncharacterized protein n=1 Tax=Mycena albidolilacea TaxID=1033008 RepID=A0AAD7EIM1_9AGAR|nr:hypothetical protein DFH08DRAFT_815827 [Mycena albidolilacea]
MFYHLRQNAFRTDRENSQALTCMTLMFRRVRAELPIVFRSVFPLYADLPTLETSVFYAELPTVFRSAFPSLRRHVRVAGGIEAYSTWTSTTQLGGPICDLPTLETSVFYAELPIVFRSAYPSLRLHWPTLKNENIPTEIANAFGTAAQYGYYNSTFTDSPHGWNCKRETDGGSPPSSENEKILCAAHDVLILGRSVVCERLGETSFFDKIEVELQNEMQLAPARQQTPEHAAVVGKFRDPLTPFFRYHAEPLQ